MDSQPHLEVTPVRDRLSGLSVVTDKPKSALDEKRFYNTLDGDS